MKVDKWSWPLLVFAAFCAVIGYFLARIIHGI